ncbi:MAG: CDGSH-type iron sulfur-containing protein, partial [Myxococcaceae bacterium]|nr:CDGSH-type iron sulfur-containing protein [Myxococcaceae bacterium]
DRPRLTPMAVDYDTVGDFYERLSRKLQHFVAAHGEDAAFCGDPGLQLTEAEVQLSGARKVICSKTALAAFKAIIEQGEGAPEDTEGSNYQLFLCIQRELHELKAKNPAFEPAFPAAVNPVLRRPTVPTGRIWIEDEEAATTVDVANTSYMLMLRMLAHSYMLSPQTAEKSLMVDISLGLMRAMTFLGERAARLPAGGADVQCNAGMSFTALRDAAALPPGAAARRFFSERLNELSEATRKLDQTDPRVASAARYFDALVKRGEKGFAQASREAAAGGLKQVAVPASTSVPARAKPQDLAHDLTVGHDATALHNGRPVPQQTKVDGIETVEGKDLTVIYEAKKCMHSRFCVTKAPKTFLANVAGPWIFPDDTETDELIEIAHECVSGAIRYRRKDGKHDELPPPVNLASVREGGPYAFRAELLLDGEPVPFRATLCRCGASKNKPFCDSSHHEVGFSASGEPATVAPTDMLPVRDGPLRIDPQLDGPLQVRGNLEILSGTGRMVSRITSARLCRCGGSNTKPFCDGTHARNGFKSE